jgi:hypothetical protein
MRHFLTFLIKCYRRFISPLFPPCCRYYPSCSAYALTALERFGALKGSLLILSRILRCHPWARGGVDEVPEHFSWKELPDYFWQDNG